MKRKLQWRNRLLHANEKMLNITSHQRDANKNHNEVTITSDLSEWLSLINQQATSPGEDAEKREP